MKRFFIAIGILLVIAGVVIVLVVGGSGGFENIKDGFRPDLSSADVCEKIPFDAEGLRRLEISTSSYTVYLRYTDEDEICVRYVSDKPEGVSIDITHSTEIVSITETDGDWSFANLFGGFSFRRRFLVVELPKQASFENVDVTLKINAGSCFCEDITVGNLSVSVDAGSTMISGVQAALIKSETDGGSINIVDTTATVIQADVDAGSLRCEATCASLLLSSNAGSINFKSNADRIDVESNAGSVNGTVLGSKNDYNIDVDVSAGSSNISSCRNEHATKSLSAEVNAGSLKIWFEDPSTPDC